MSNRLSFAQILTKKQGNDLNNGSRISTSRNGYQQTYYNSQIGSQYRGSPMPTLIQIMNEYVQYPESPQQNYILSFNEGQNQEEMNEGQDYGTGVNPLDSWIMSKNNLKNQRNKSNNNFPNAKSMKYSQNKGQSLMSLSKKYNATRQQSNQNFGNIGNIFKFSTKNYQISVGNSQQQPRIDSSRKYSPASPSSYSKNIVQNQMIKNTKIIESQVYQNPENRKDSLPMSKIQIQSPKIMIDEPKQQNNYKKLPRYHQNYQQTNKLLIGQKYKEENNTDNKGKILKLIKKQTHQQQLLIAGLDDLPSRKVVNQPQTEQDKRLQDAKRQIQQYLQIKQKNPNDEQKYGAKSALIKHFNKITEVTNQIPPENSSNMIHYSFAQYQIPPQNLSSNLPQTNQELKKIIQQKRVQDNERMLQCIKYAQSQGEGENQKQDINQNDQLPQQKKNTEYNPQNIQQKKPTQQVNLPTCEKNVEQSQIIEKIQIVPDPINPSPQQNIQCLQFKGLSSQNIPHSIGKSPQRVAQYEDSSINIHISDDNSQSPERQKQCMIPTNQKLSNQTHHLLVPKLAMKISDVSNVSNQSNSNSHASQQSPIRQTPIQQLINQKSSQIQLNLPISSNIGPNNIQPHANNYGYIYTTRVNSKNNSFTSNYNQNFDHSLHTNSLDHSNNYSMQIKQGKEVKQENNVKNGDKKQQIMIKNKEINMKYNQVEPIVHKKPPITMEKQSDQQQNTKFVQISQSKMFLLQNKEEQQSNSIPPSDKKSSYSSQTQNKMLIQNDNTIKSKISILSSSNTNIQPFPQPNVLKNGTKKQVNNSIVGSIHIKSSYTSSMNKNREQFQFDLDF